MSPRVNNRGFSLTEVVMALGILAVGIIFIAGTFSAGIRFAGVTSERTIASVVADEAFAKIKLHDLNLRPVSPIMIPIPPIQANQQTMLTSAYFNVRFDPNEFFYPSTDPTVQGWEEKRYFWSAMARLVDVNSVQVTVFICRRVGANPKFPDPDGQAIVGTMDGYSKWPLPLKIGLGAGSRRDILEMSDPNIFRFINEGYTLVTEARGDIYRVLERVDTDPSDSLAPHLLFLDRPLEQALPVDVWVVPPAIKANRYPCVAVYQKLMYF
jgi:prepilin-type N-terminal cleavage/methylation domain-containing protein